MSDFLTRLALRQLGQIVTIEQRVAPLYGAANQARNPSFGEDTEYRRVTNAQEAVAMPERTIIQTRGRLPAHADDPVTSTEQPIVQLHAGSHEPTQRIDAQPFAAEFRINKAGPFAVEASASSPTNFSTGEPSANVPRRQQTEPARAESVPRERMPVAPMVRTAPVAPSPLVKPTHSGLTPLNEFTAPVVFGSEEDRWREQAQRDKETPVHVTIGRIEVTAMTAPAAPRRASLPRKPAMSLDDYLARRQRRES